MKKCPKCGTILDDSKKKCYMCGSILKEENKLDFAETLDQAVGSAVVKESDNIFNNGEDIKVKASDVVKKNSDEAMFTQDGDAHSTLSDEMSRLTSIKTNADEEPKKTPPKASKDNSKSDLKKELLKDKQEQLKKEQEQKAQEKIKKTQEEAEKRQKMRMEKAQAAKKKAEEQKKQKIKKNKKNKQKFIPNIAEPKEETKPHKQHIQQITINKSFLVNGICIILFIALLVFAYTNYTHRGTKKQSLMGLLYMMPSSFKESSSSSFVKYYTYGESCTIRITYGSETITSATFVDEFLESQRLKLESDKQNKAKRTEEKINDNTWSSMEIVSFSDDKTNSKLQEKLKYKYSAILYNANFYYIVFSNNANDATCKNLYTEFESTLEFEK